MNTPRLDAQQVRDAAERRGARLRRVRTHLALVAAAVVVVLDQVVKSVVRATMEMGEAHTIIPRVVSLRRVINEGIAFGFFPGNTTVVAVLTVLALAAIGVAMARLVGRNTPASLGGGMLLGGAAGNLFDRVVHGGVTDFIDFRWFPAFNVADMGITVGAALLVLGLMMLDDAEDDAHP